MRRRSTVFTALALGVLPALLPATAGAQTGGRDPAPDPRVAQLERDFLLGMIPHHREASMMAEMAVRKATRPELRRLAQGIIEEQTAEIDKMSRFLRDWYGAEPPAAMAMPMDAMMRMMMAMMGMDMSTMGGMGSMPGMTMGHGGMGTGADLMPDMAARMRALEAKTGADFDVEFLSAMTDHHSMAVLMASMVLAAGHHADLYTLAEQIVISQGEEIKQMDEWLGAWYGVQRPV